MAAAQPLNIAGVTLVQNEQGVALKYGWLYSQQISVADAVRIRDWLDANYPKGAGLIRGSRDPSVYEPKK